MKKCIGLILVSVAVFAGGCVGLSPYEKMYIRELRAKGITADTPYSRYEAPNSILTASLLNLLPGIGNFYLASGSGNDSTQAVYGVINFLFWPHSIFWGVPQAAIDANTLNKRDMLDYYRYTSMGKKDAAKLGIVFE